MHGMVYVNFLPPIIGTEASRPSTKTQIHLHVICVILCSKVS